MRLSQACGPASIRANAMPSRKIQCFESLRNFAGVMSGRQKGLVDHVCPASFSYREANRKIPLTIVT
jgi:hypothetical protein